MSSLARDLGELATRRARSEAPVAGADPPARRIREGIAALLRGDVPVAGGMSASAASPDALLELPGAELVEVEGTSVLAIRRDVDELTLSEAAKEAALAQRFAELEAQQESPQIEDELAELKRKMKS